jgi:hypothetical protein
MSLGRTATFCALRTTGNLNQSNSVAFDQQLNGFGAGINGIVADFDFRMTDHLCQRDHGPDGMSFNVDSCLGQTIGRTGSSRRNGSGAGFHRRGTKHVPRRFRVGVSTFINGGVLWNEASFALERQRVIAGT